MRLEKAYMHWHGYDLLGGHSRGNYTRNKIMHRILRSVIQKCRHFVPSNFYREILVNKFSVPVQNITISPSGGVNMDIFKPVNMERKNSAWNIGFASGLAYEKGAGMLFDIMLKYKTIEEKINMPVVFNIINYAQDAEELTQKMNAANIPIIVWERMNKSDMYKFHNSIDVLIMTSESESLGLVVLEAMACGKPAVTFDICAFPDFVLPGISGERVELTRDSQTNADNFIAALVKIKNNYAAYNPRSITAGSYSEAAVVETYKKVFGLYD
jgi:glycosyltransferase involved in cell wall biosynthesis